MGNASLEVCWSCQGPVHASKIFCPVCQAIQPLSGQSHFERLDLFQKFDISLAELERQYQGLMAMVHPDKFAVKSGKEQLISQQRSLAYNEAYTVLKSPVQRALYLLKLERIVFPQSDNDGEITSDPELLLEIMELRESLAEIETDKQAMGLTQLLNEKIKEAFREVSNSFTLQDFDDITLKVMRLKYFDKLLQDTKIKASQFMCTNHLVS